MAYETVNSIGYTGETPDSVVGLPFGLQNASVSDGEVSPFVTVSDLETKTASSPFEGENSPPSGDILQSEGRSRLQHCPLRFSLICKQVLLFSQHKFTQGSLLLLL